MDIIPSIMNRTASALTAEQIIYGEPLATPDEQAALEAEWEDNYFRALGEFGPAIDEDALAAVQSLDDQHDIDHETYVHYWLTAAETLLPVEAMHLPDLLEHAANAFAARFESAIELRREYKRLREQEAEAELAAHD